VSRVCPERSCRCGVADHRIEPIGDRIEAVLEQCGIRIEGHRRGGVAEHPLDRFDVGSEKPLLGCRELPAHTWQLHHFLSGPDERWHAPWAQAVAGADAAWVEMTDVDGTVRRPLEAPLSYFTIASNGDGAAEVEALEQAGSSLGRRNRPRQV